MMRKIHRVALAAYLKPATQELEPKFSLVSTAWARAFGSERRFAFFAPWNTGYGFVIFEPSATATDDYFTVDIAWIRGAAAIAPEAIGDELTVPEIAPWKGRTEAQLLAQERFRLRIDDLWKSSPQAYRGSFRFATASSRYIEQLALIGGLTGKEREDRAFELLRNCMAEEKSTSDAQALAEVTPAAQLALQAITDAVIPAFRLAEELASASRHGPST